MNISREIVTVVVITYHSAKTVVETLESIRGQTYGPEYIELIISDDGSKDNTIQIIIDWLQLNQNCFHRVKLFPNSDNSGVSRNCNIAWKAATSEWIKTIAGDDVLLNDCIENNMTHVKEHANVSVVFSKMHHFIGNVNNITKTSPSSGRLSFFDLESEQQYKYLLRDSFNFAPTSFINKKVLEAVGYCDERYRLIEDLPLWLKITKAGYSLSFLNIVTVCYRLSDSISNNRTRLTNVAFIQQLYSLHELEVWPNFSGFSRWRVMDRKIQLSSFLIAAKLFRNKRNVVSVFVQKLISASRPSTFIRLGKVIFRFLSIDWLRKI